MITDKSNHEKTTRNIHPVHNAGKSTVMDQ